MLHILMMILKIIGIIILIFLGIVLLVICSVLFAPISYKVHGKWMEDKQIKGSVSWLFSILRFSFAYENGEFVSAFQIFGIRRKEKEKADSGKRKERKKKEKTPTNKALETMEVKQENAEPVKTLPARQEQNEEYTEAQTEEYREIKTEKTNEKSRMEKIKEKLFQFFYNIKCKIKRICAIIKNRKEKWDWYHDFWQAESTQNAITFVKGELFRLLKKIKPKKIKGYLRIGMDDPAATGQIYGGICVLQVFAFMDVQVIPEFEQKILEADIYGKGQIMIFTLLKTGVKIYFNKAVRQTMEQWKQKE